MIVIFWQHISLNQTPFVNAYTRRPIRIYLITGFRHGKLLQNVYMFANRLILINKSIFYCFSVYIFVDYAMANKFTWQFSNWDVIRYVIQFSSFWKSHTLNGSVCDLENSNFSLELNNLSHTHTHTIQSIKKGGIVMTNLQPILQFQKQQQKISC